MLAPEAERVTEFPEQIVAALTASVGVIFTVTLTVIELLQLFMLVPVNV